ncbi:hypothetical protein GCM10020331_094220 [Ectobacillus funiculus]
MLIKGPRRGWEMPGGQVEEGGIIKKMQQLEKQKEECGLDIMITKFCGVFQKCREV